MALRNIFSTKSPSKLIKKRLKNSKPFMYELKESVTNVFFSKNLIEKLSF